VPATITLLTDFGLSDTYVGQVKGAVCRVAPDAQLIDLTHEVPSHDVRTGAFLLLTSVEVFAPGTVHLAVVDPGVGSARLPVAVRTGRGDVLVGPDNGLLAPAAERLGGAAQVVALDPERVTDAPRSRTFDGRDLFAPAAAKLARGVPLEALGEVQPALSLPFTLPQAQTSGPFIHGEVLHVDTFGNLVTNIPAGLLPERFLVRVGDAQVGGPVTHYGAVQRGELLALVGSAGYLEVSARDASASLRTQARRADLVIVQAG
jgi:S-adenosylmethionine hydrolase